jgi:hypothetical protein
MGKGKKRHDIECECEDVIADGGRSCKSTFVIGVAKRFVTWIDDGEFPSQRKGLRFAVLVRIIHLLRSNTFTLQGETSSDRIHFDCAPRTFGAWQSAAHCPSASRGPATAEL